MQTTLLGLAIAFIIALVAALVGPYFVDWNQFRPQFEAEASRVLGAPVRVGGALDARLLPAPSLRLRSVVVGGANDRGRIRADKLDVEFSLSSLMRGEWRATELTINGAALDLGLDAQGRIDLPASTGRFNLGALAIDRLNLTGRVALHDAASRSTLELNDIAFSGDVRSLAGAMRGDGNFTLKGTRYPFRVSSGQTVDGSGTRVHLTIDPGQRPIFIDLDGVLFFDGRAPRFDGGLVLAGPPSPKAKSGDDKSPAPWRLSARLKANPAAAKLEQIEISYGPEEMALKLAGLAEVRFGPSPLLHAVLAARQLDADRLLARDVDAGAPGRLLPWLRKMFAELPQPPLATQIEASAEQIMLGGRPVQNLGADLHGDATAWTIDRLDFRAPGATRVTLSGIAQGVASGNFNGAVSLDSSDPDTLAAWLQGRSEVTHRSQKPLRLRGDVSVTADRFAIDAIKAEIDGGTVDGRVAFSNAAGSASRFEADVKADRLDVDAAAALLRSLAGPPGDWPDVAQLSLDIDRAVSAGQEMHPFVAQFGYGPDTISLDRLKIGEATTLLLEGSGSFNRIEATGTLALSAASASLTKMTALLVPLAPAVAARLNTLSPAPGRANIKLTFDLGRDSSQADRASARAVVDIAAPQVSGVTTFTATPSVAAMRSLDIDALSRSEITVESRLAADRGSQLLTLLGLDGALAAGDAPLGFEGSATGTWRAPLRVKVRLAGTELDADAQGTAELWGEQPKAVLALAVRRANVAPLFDLKASDALAQNIGFSARATLAADKLTLDDIDSTVAGARMRGRLALTLGTEKTIDGQLGMDAIELAPAFGLVVGARGHDTTEPLGRGLLQGWRGQLAFQALRGALPGGIELRPLSGLIKSDGQSFSIEGMKGNVGGGEVTADIDVKPGLTGLALNAHIQLANVDGGALRYRALAMPSGRVSLRTTLATQGRTAFGLEGALSGNGLLSIDAARIAGLNPDAFDVAIRASDSGQATDDNRLRQIVERSLATGALPVAAAQIPFLIKDGRLRVGATTLDAGSARAVVSGGYDFAADQTDVRVALTSMAGASGTARPEIQLFMAGSPDRLERTVDVAALSSWLAVRAIDRETRRLDSLERGEVPPATPPAAVAPIAPLETTQEPSASQLLALPPAADVPMPGRDPRRAPSRPALPRPAALPQDPTASSVSQQLAPLPAPIEIRPAPGAARSPRPRSAPPLVLTPPANSTRQ